MIADCWLIWVIRCGYVAKGNIELTRWPLFRDRLLGPLAFTSMHTDAAICTLGTRKDCTYYICSLAVLASFTYNQTITAGEVPVPGLFEAMLDNCSCRPSFFSVCIWARLSVLCKDQWHLLWLVVLRWQRHVLSPGYVSFMFINRPLNIWAWLEQHSEALK